jgi:hypothetical protein
MLSLSVTRRHTAFGGCGIAAVGFGKTIVVAFDVTTKNSKRREFS